MNLRYIFAPLIPLLVGLLSFQAQCAIPTATQVTMSKQIESGIEWAKHLSDDAKKGRKIPIKEIDGEVSGVLSFLSAMDTTANEVLRESPSEKTEGHFTEMRKFQEAARVAANEFNLARQENPRPNYSKMKGAAKKILRNLEDAKHWHDLELSEIEKNPKD